MKLILKHYEWNARLVLLVVPMVALEILSGCILLGIESRIDKSVLTSSSCQLPCWHGIVPGSVMTEEEIVRILETMPEVRTVRVQQCSGRKLVWWDWIEGGKEVPRWRYNSYVSLSTPRGTVEEIALQVVFDLTVEEVLGQHGVPEGITVQARLLTGDSMNWVVSLLYPTQGMKFEVAIPWYRDNPCILEPTARVFEVVYFAPAESLPNWTKYHRQPPLLPWSGYGELRSVEP